MDWFQKTQQKNFISAYDFEYNFKRNIIINWLLTGIHYHVSLVTDNQEIVSII